jgi:hypothetical protein
VPRSRSRFSDPRVALFALVLGCYAYFYQAGGWNQNSRFDLTRAMVERHSLRIDAYVHNTGDDSKRDGHFYCDKAPVVSWLGIPTHAALWLAAGKPARPSPQLLAWSSYLASVAAVAIPSAIAAGFLFVLLAALGLSAAWAAAATLAYALATLAFPYSTLFYGHQLVAALHLVAFALLVQMRRGLVELSTGRLVAVGALLGTAVAVEYPAALGGAVLGLYALWALRPRARVLGWIVAGGLVPIVLLGAYHASAFGGPFTLPYTFSTQKHRHMGWFMGLGVPDFHVLAQLLGSVRRGLLYSAPWLALALPGLIVWLRRAEARAEAVVCTAIIVLHLWLNSSLVDWDGGWCVGPRYLVSCLPFVVIGAAGVVPWLRAWPRAPRFFFVGLVGALVAVALYLMLAATAVKPEVPSAVRAPFGDYVLPAFRRGDLGISTQSIDRPDMPAGGPPQAWNLGQRLGLEGKLSLLPLGLWVLVTGAWLLRALRRRDPGAADAGGDAAARVAS